MKKFNFVLAVLLARKCFDDVLSLADPITADKEWGITSKEEQLELISHIITRDSHWTMESVDPELKEFVQHLHELRASDPKLEALLSKPFLRRLFSEPWGC